MIKMTPCAHKTRYIYSKMRVKWFENEWYLLCFLANGDVFLFIELSSIHLLLYFLSLLTSVFNNMAWKNEISEFSSANDLLASSTIMALRYLQMHMSVQGASLIWYWMSYFFVQIANLFSILSYKLYINWWRW